MNLRPLLIMMLTLVAMGCAEDPDVADDGELMEPGSDCDGVQVLHLSGQVLDVNGEVPDQPNFTLCAGACLRGQLETDGTFLLETDFCFPRNPPLTRPVFIYHGAGEYTDLYVDFVPPDASLVESQVFTAPFHVVARQDMSQVTLEEGQPGLLEDGQGFELQFDSARLPFGQDVIAVQRLDRAVWPNLEGIETLTALYATLPEGVAFAVPATVRFPNTEGLSPGAEVEIVAIGTIDTGEVYAGTLGRVANGVVNDAGDAVVLEDGEGLSAMTWIGYRPRP